MKYVTTVHCTLDIIGTVRTDSLSPESAEGAARWAASCAMEEAASAAFSSAALDVSSQGAEVSVLGTEVDLDES
jgi:hypothetical protein